MLGQFLKGLINIVYPNVCLLCRRQISQDAQLICVNCTSVLKNNAPPFCQKCGRQLITHNELGLCALCQRNKLHFKRAYSAFLYAGEIRQLISLFKYKGKMSLSRPLANMLTEFVKQYKIPLQQMDVIMPIPLHSARLREREYNQSQLLAQELVNKFDLRLDTKSLMRARNTIPQVNLSDKQRWQNISGAFKLRKTKSISNKTVLLVDDLMTTGATCSEAACILRDGGAKEVYVLTLASTN